MNLKWAGASYYTNLGLAVCNSITHDASGNVIQTGHFGGLVDFDPGPSTYTMSDAPIFVTKLDANGNLLWAKGLATNSTAFLVTGFGVQVDGTGNIFVTGAFHGTIDLNPGTGTYTVATMGQTDVFLVKLDQSGNFLWGHTIGSVWAESGKALDVDAAGNVYLTGLFNNTLDLDPGLGTNTVVSAGQADIFVSKFSSTGAFLWGNSFGGVGHDECPSLKVDASGDVYTTGNYFSGIDFDPGPSTFSVAGTGFFVNKLSTTGNFVMARSMAQTITTYVRSLFVDGNGNIYTCGQFAGSGDFDPGSGIVTLSSTGGYFDAFISKLDPSGNHVWAKSFGGVLTNDYAYSIAVDQSGNVYTTGEFFGTADFDPGSSSYTLASAGYFDIFLHKLDQSGNFVWANKFGSSGTNDRGSAVTVDQNKNIHLTGYLAYPADFDPSNITYTIGNNYETAYAAKFCQSNPLVVTASGPLAFCEGGSVTLSVSSGNSYSWSTSSTSPSINVSATGNYTVTVTDLSGCAAHSLITVLADPIPTITVSNATICAGQFYTINPQGAVSYSISGGNFTVSPSQTTSYSVSGSSSIGCPASNTAVLTVSVEALPTITVSNGSLCVGQVFTLSPAGAVNYSYSSGSPVVSPMSNTSYTITGYSIGGCAGAAAVAQVSVYNLPVIASNSGTVCVGQAFVISPSGANTYTISGGVFTVTPSSTSSYTISGTSLQGCLSLPVVLEVTVHPLPVVSVNSGSICPGDTFSISPSGAFNYSVSGGSWLVSPVLSTSYSVLGESTLGCVSSGAAVSHVTVFPKPTATITSTPSILCVGESATLVAIGASGYLWQTGATTHTLVINPLSTQVFSVTITSIESCTAVSTFTSLVNICTSLKPDLFSGNRSLVYYPNPAKDVLHIELTGRDQGSLQISSLLNETVLYQDITSRTTSVDLRSIMPGVYAVTVVTLSGKQTFKIIKE